MNGKFSVVHLVAVGVVAALGAILLARAFVAPFVKVPKHKHVLITIQNNKCSQQADGISDAFTFLRKRAFLFAGDDVQWTVKDYDHGGSSFEIRFPQTTPDGRVGTPFVDGSGMRKFVFTDRDNHSGTSPESTASGDYSYESVDGVPCDADPGVHVDN